VIVMEAEQPIAVVGLACRFPGAGDVEQFWANLVAARESITFFEPADLSDEATRGLRDNPDYVAAAPVLDGADLFDAGLFGMTPHEAQLCDPQFRVFLQICHSALENAGYDPFAMPDSVGVFGSAGPSSYLSRILRYRPDLAGTSRMLAQSLNQPDYLASLVAYRLNLTGPAMTVLTACSSTLVALHLACQALRTGDCDTALAGGCVIRFHRGHRWTPGGVRSADGHCRPFDAAASGTIFGSGAAAVVLKRLDDAVADGDRITAVVLGSAVNNDGARKVSFSAPSVAGQAAVVMEAMTLAGVGPADIGYVEAHATGTALGDPVEVAALGEAFTRLYGGPLPPASCLLGSVKSNIGHMDEVAGIAGFIKTALALDRGAIPPTINLDTPNPLLELDKTPFELCTQLRLWQRAPGLRRVAGVTSLGVGGTNVHAVLAEGPPPAYRVPGDHPHLLVWSARTKEGEADLRELLARHLATLPSEQFADTVSTLQFGRTSHPVRGALVARSPGGAVASLAGEQGSAEIATGTATDGPRIAFLLPGQGAQYARMGAGLYGRLRAFTLPMDECIELFEEQGIPLYRQWREVVDDEGLAAARLAQPLLFAVEYALAAQWRQWGAAPAAVLGHSLGELTGAAVAGVFTLPAAVRLVAARAEAMAANPAPGGMLAVSAAEDDIAGLVGGSLAVAAVNSGHQVVVSGPEADLASLATKLAERRVAHRRVAAGAAFHHPGWARAAQAWATAFEGIVAAPARAEVFSAAAGGQVDAATLADPRFWTRQLTQPVRFHDALGALLATRPDLLVEAGPRDTLTSLARRHPARGFAACIPTLAHGRDAYTEVLAAAGRLWVAGARLDWAAAGTPPPRTRVALPGYPYERTRHWVGPEGPSQQPPDSAGISQQNGMTHSRDREDAPSTPDPLATGAVTEVAWSEGPRRATARVEGPPTGALVLVPDGVRLDDTWSVWSAARQAGLRPTLVRPGDGPGERDGEFLARPGSLADLENVLAALARDAEMPRLLVHAVSATPAAPAGTAADRAEEWFTSLLALSRLALVSPLWPAPPRLLLITTQSVDVTGAEPLDPARAALHGLLRTVRSESPALGCLGVDINGHVDPAALAAELTVPSGQAAVALRGRRRWVPQERALSIPAMKGSALRQCGVYLITGGGGGLGLAVAEGIARTGVRPRLALLGRRDPAKVVPDRLAHLRSLGAQVHTYACDVADPAALSATLHVVTEQCGPINGVLHLAGVPGKRMVAFREPADAAAVLAPKTSGTVALERALAGRPLDFVVYFSSRAAVDGLVGGGDYAAANAFLDAAAQRSPLLDARVLSIGWPVWLGAGMASSAGVDVAGLGRAMRRASARRSPAASGHTSTGPAALRSTQLQPAAPSAATVWDKRMSPATDWVLDEHRVGRVPLLPGTGYLDLVVRAYRDVVVGEPMPLEIADMVFRAPLFDQRARMLRIAFQPDGPQHAVEVSSWPADAEGPTVIHATARILPAYGSPATIDLTALRARFAAAGRPVQSPSGNRLFVLGPHWQNITGTWLAQDEKLLRIELPAPYLPELSRHPVHPALLDTATAAVRWPGQASTVPFRYRRLVLWRDLPGRFYVHVRPDPGAPRTAPGGDLDLIADDGAVVANVEGFTMVLTDAAKLGREQRSDRRDKAVPAHAEGLDPRLGVGLLFRLLEADLRGHVLVRPFVDGRPAPFATTPASGASSSAPASAAVGPPPAVTDASPDRQASSPGQGGDTGAAAPDDALSRLRTVWRQVLGVDEVLPEQDFFDAGGNSLTAVELMAAVRDVFGVELSIGLLLEAPTFARLAGLLRERDVIP
jgi:acyl transferase domain-containing protein